MLSLKMPYFTFVYITISNFVWMKMRSLWIAQMLILSRLISRYKINLVISNRNRRSHHCSCILCFGETVRFMIFQIFLLSRDWYCRMFNLPDKAKKQKQNKTKKFVCGRWPENLNAKCFFFLFWNVKVNFQVNIHVILQIKKRNKTKSKQIYLFVFLC